MSILRVDINEADEMTTLNLLAQVRDKSVSAINKADKGTSFDGCNY